MRESASYDFGSSSMERRANDQRRAVNATELERFVSLDSIALRAAFHKCSTAAADRKSSKAHGIADHRAADRTPGRTLSRTTTNLPLRPLN